MMVCFLSCLSAVFCGSLPADCGSFLCFELGMMSLVGRNGILYLADGAGLCLCSLLHLRV